MHISKITIYGSVFLYALLFNWKLLSIQLLILAFYYGNSWLISKKHHTSVRRKTSIGTWNQPGDPSVFNNLEVDASKLDNFIEAHNKKYPEARVSYTHIMLKALAYSLKQVKGLNSTIAFGNFIPIDDIDITCLVDIEGKNLATMVVKDCHRLNILEIKKQISGKVAKLKTRKNKDFNKQMGIVNFFHSSILSMILELCSFLAYHLGLDIELVKIKKRGFGTALITSVANMEIYNSYAPLVPFTKAICVILICKPRMRAMVDENNEFVAKKMMNINATFDHRYCDGNNASVVIKSMYSFFDNIETLAYQKFE